MYAALFEESSLVGFGRMNTIKYFRASDRPAARGFHYIYMRKLAHVCRGTCTRPAVKGSGSIRDITAK